MIKHNYYLKNKTWFWILVKTNIIVSIMIMYAIKSVNIIDTIGLICQNLLVFMFIIKQPRLGALFATISSSIFSYQMFQSDAYGTNLLLIKGIYFTIFNVYQVYLTTKKEYLENFLEHSAQKKEIIFSITFGALGIILFLGFSKITISLVFILALMTYAFGFVSQIFETFGNSNQFLVWTITDFIGLIYALVSSDESSMVRYGIFVILQIQAMLLINYEKNKSAELIDTK